MMGTALQEADAEFSFQPLHLLAQRRLYDVLPLGRPAEVQLLRQRYEVAKLPQLHAHRQVPVQYIPGSLPQLPWIATRGRSPGPSKDRITAPGREIGDPPKAYFSRALRRTRRAHVPWVIGSGDGPCSHRLFPPARYGG